MSRNTSNYQHLIRKLDRFIRKYYINKLLGGALFTIAILLGLFLSFSLIEHQFYLSQSGRKLLFFGFLSTSIIALVYWVLMPLLQFFSLGNVISHEQAAQIVGNHFGDVQDKLLNILQLKKNSLTDSALIDASINQKADSIKLVPFPSAIDLSKNRKYLRYALPPFLILLFLLFAAPSIIRDSTYRIINNNTDFERTAPFKFVLANTSPQVLQYENYNLEVKIEGETLPEEVFITIDDYQYRLQKKDQETFGYRFNNVQKSQDFKIFSGSVTSKDYQLEVLPKPALLDFSLFLDYPSYTGRSDESLRNIGDAIMPQGTTIKWKFETNNSESLLMRFGRKKTLKIEQNGLNSFKHKKRFFKDEQYTTIVSNQYVPLGDSVIYNISVIPDRHPTINIERFQDSIETEVFYFVGSASDDYGLKSLSFNYEVINEQNNSKGIKTLPLSQPTTIEISFEHLFDFRDIALNPGDKVNYYFEIFDNDGVNGSKSTKTQIQSFEKRSIEEFKKLEDDNEEEIKDELLKSMEEAKKLREELQKLREELLQKKELNWQDKKEIEKLLERQNELQKQLEDAKEKFDENLKNQNEFAPQSEEIQQKQEEIQELFEELMDPKMQELMQQIQELMEELNKENSLEMLEELEMDDKQLEKEMDRLLELFKQLEVEKEIKETIEELEKLAEEQEALAEETEQKEKPQEELKTEQEEIQDKMDDIQEKMEELEEKNEALEYPKEMGDDNEEQIEDIQDDMQESQEQLEQNENQKASKSQKAAAQKMKQMAAAMQQQMESGQMEQMEEDIQALRQLLENIVNLSFDQEDLVDKVQRTNVNTPKYVKLVQRQFKIKNDFQLVEDSLQELSKRVSQIETFVTEKVTEINYDVAGAIKQLENRLKPTATQHQRLAMKNLNDLAIMLDESMQQMQQQMSGMMPGNQMCDKPGGNKPKSGHGQAGAPVDKITEGQEGLSEQLKKMIEQKKNGKKGGQSGSEGVSSKQFAEAAAKQAALRKALEEIKKLGEQAGEGSSKELQEIMDQMDQNEVDLVNKKLDAEMLTRQQEILTRLLEAEKADKQREYDNKRKGETAKQIEKKIPAAIEEYIKKRKSEIEMYKSISPALKPYYKYLVEKYYHALKSKN